MIKIAIGSDHAAYDEKKKIITFLENNGYQMIDVGPNSNDSVDYPEYGHKVAKMVVNKEVEKGIVLCGSGIGISIAANKIKGARAALCTSYKHAEMSRKHNNSNILALGARMTEYDVIVEIINVWLETEFEGGRHLNRINKIEI